MQKNSRHLLRNWLWEAMFFFLDNAITGYKCLKSADISMIVQGIYTPSKKIVTNSGVLGDLKNYHSLCSPYDTWYCAIFMEIR